MFHFRKEGEVKVSEFSYDLPEELIAQTPIEKRDESRLMVLDREKQTIEHKRFKDIIEFLKPGDVLVRNNSKVIPARLYGTKKDTGAKVEVLILKIENDICECLCGNAKAIKTGTTIIFSDNTICSNVLKWRELCICTKYYLIL